MDRLFFALGAIFGALGVAAGAFGAHALRAHLAPEALAIFDTGARYQLVHALALFATAWAWTRWRCRAITIAGFCFAAGIVLFSGSLYALALLGVRAFGALAPVGGTLLIVGWVALAVAAWRAPAK